MGRLSGLAGGLRRPGSCVCGEMTPSFPGLFLVRGAPWFLFFNIAIIILNWTRESDRKLFLREKLLQRDSNYRIIHLMKDNNS